MDLPGLEDLLTSFTTASISERLAAGLIRMPNGCLEWTGSTNADGYGRISIGHSQMPLTHRAAWTLANGSIPDGLCVLHHCDNPPCCQTEPTEGYPEGHLFLGTNADNVADMVAKGRNRHRDINREKTHCKRGHLYSAENTYVTPQGFRQCMKCNALTARARRTERTGIEFGSKAAYCMHGHPYDEANTFMTPKGRRCRTCRQVSKQRFAATKKAQS